MEGKNSFIAYCNWSEIFDELTNEKAGQLIKHLFAYVNDKDPQSDDVIIKLAFVPIKQSLKRDLKQWNKYIEKQSINGKKGGRPKKAKESQKTQRFSEKPKKADNVNVNVNDNVNDNVNVNDNETPLKTDAKNKFSPFMQEMKAIFEKWFKNHNGVSYQWAAKDDKALGGLIAKFKKTLIESNSTADTEDVKQLFTTFLGKLPPWFQENNCELTTLNGKYNSIINQIIQTNGKQASAVESLAEEIRRRRNGQ